MDWSYVFCLSCNDRKGRLETQLCKPRETSFLLFLASLLKDLTQAPPNPNLLQPGTPWWVLRLA